MALPLYEKFAQVMVHLCSHDGDGGHGYSQAARYGDGTSETITLSDGTKVKVANGDRDCSSAICSALTAVGVDVRGASYTGNMRSCLLRTGLFEWVPMSVNRPAKRGDIYLNEGHHTAMCTNDDPDMLCQFSISETGKVTGKKGDQTGRESNFRAYYSYPWDGRLCWKDRENAGKSIDGRLVVDGWVGELTVADAQSQLGTTVDGVISGQEAEWRKYAPRLVSVDAGTEGSDLVAAMQRRLGVKQTRQLDPQTIAALQVWLVGLGYDLTGDRVGYLDDATARAFQETLNEGKWKG